MATFLMVIVGFFCFGIVRGGNFSFERRLKCCKPMMKKPGVFFYRRDSPFDQKKFNFWLVLYPLSYQVGRNLQKEWEYLASAVRNVQTFFRFKEFSVLSPPHSPLL